MTTFDVHTLASAPADSKPVLEGAKQAFGSIPNLFAVFAESPAAVKAYAELGTILDRSTAFTKTELQVVLIAVSFENDCAYCVAAHTAIAGMQKVPQDVIKSLRDGTAIADPKLEALRVFTRAVVEQRGWLEQSQVQAFVAAGYTKRHMLEVIVGVSFKTMSNFTNHLASTPLDAPFQRFAWSKPEAATAN